MSTKGQDHKGKLIFHDEVKKYTNDGKVKSAEDSVVHHAEDGYYARYFKKTGTKSTKIEIKSGAAGGEYTLTVTEDGDKKTSTHNKADITAYLKKNPSLQFILDYVVKTKALARANTKKKAAKKSKSKSKSKKSASKSKKSAKKSASKKSASKKSASKKSASKKSKSKSKSKSAKRSMARKPAPKKSASKKSASKKSHSKKAHSKKSASKKSASKKSASKKAHSKKTAHRK